MSTIRRIPSIAPVLETTPTSPPSLLALEVSLKCDTHNIDAQHGGECLVLCKVAANYTLPPSSDRTRGFDGVVVFDTKLEGRSMTLAIDAVATIVDATSPNDRLGFVTFGTQSSVISELIMCTTPYKQALQSSVREIKTSQSARLERSHFVEGMKLALQLLVKDARFGGHIFLISDGNLCVQDVSPWRNSSTTIHTVGTGALIHPYALRQFRHKTGTFLEFRSSSDSAKLAKLVAYLATHAVPHAIETVRCRLTSPDTILEITPHPSISEKDQISITLGIPVLISLSFLIFPSINFR